MGPEDFWSLLLRFHGEIVLPDMKRLEERLDSRINALRNETLTHFDGVYKRFDRLETEYASLFAAVRRLEQR